MERRLPTLKSVLKIITLLFILSLAAAVYGQAPEQKEQLRLQVWSMLDSFPGKFEDDTPKNQQSQEEKSEFQKLYGYSIEQTRLISPYLINGMLNGWYFEYTPYDKTRGVKEFWSFEYIHEYNRELNPLEFHSPLVDAEEGKLICWVYCDRTPLQQAEFKRWMSIVHPRVKGKGTGKVEDEFEGIKEAVSEAAKNAVREYWRTYTRNKPKEISGSLILINDPRIYIQSGEYHADLDFYLKTDRVVDYKTW